jgi:hypothetical protein
LFFSGSVKSDARGDEQMHAGAQIIKPEQYPRTLIGQANYRRSSEELRNIESGLCVIRVARNVLINWRRRCDTVPRLSDVASLEGGSEPLLDSDSEIRSY